MPEGKVVSVIPEFVACLAHIVPFLNFIRVLGLDLSRQVKTKDPAAATKSPTPSISRMLGTKVVGNGLDITIVGFFVDASLNLLTSRGDY